MSDLTRCNYCNFRDYKAQAKREGKKVIRKRSSFGTFDGYDVMIVPKDVKIPKTVDSGWKEFRDKYFVSWMWVIGKRCEC